MTGARRGVIALVVLVAVSIGCGTSDETKRKQAQSTGDKFWELIKAGSPERAYQETFSSRYKRMLNADSFKSFNDAIWSKFGTIDSYSVVRFEPDKTTQWIVMTYAVQATGYPAPLMFELKLGPEGSDWRIEQYEPKIEKPNQPNPQTGPVAPGQPAPAPGKPAPSPAPAPPAPASPAKKP